MVARFSRPLLWLLPWLPLGIAFGAAMEWLYGDRPVLVSTTKMMGSLPAVYTTSWEQLREIYPHVALFLAYIIVAGVAFLAGIALLVFRVAFRRHAHSHGTQTI